MLYKNNGLTVIVSVFNDTAIGKVSYRLGFKVFIHWSIFLRTNYKKRSTSMYLLNKQKMSDNYFKVL
jgi:hypothetical protein